MNLELFLQVSRLMNKLPGTDKFNFHLTRYKYFYDNSSKKHNCTYAQQTLQAFLTSNEKEKVIGFLQAYDANELKQLVEKL